MFDYYYGNEAEQFSFIRVPRFLFEDNKLRKMSSDLKMLYSLLLDRMCLSVKNGWIDEENRVYIVFTLREAMTKLGCGHDKATSLFTELEETGLIRRKKRGMGKPAIIYVKNFISSLPDDEVQTDENAAIVESVENSESAVIQQTFNTNPVETVGNYDENALTSENPQ